MHENTSKIKDQEHYLTVEVKVEDLLPYRIHSKIHQLASDLGLNGSYNIIHYIRFYKGYNYYTHRAIIEFDDLGDKALFTLAWEK